MNEVDVEFDLTDGESEETKAVRVIEDKASKAVGRPTIYNKAIGEAICALVSTTEKSMKEICDLLGVNYRSVKIWLRKHPEFEADFRDAKQDQMEEMEAKILLLASSPLSNENSMAEANMRKLAVETRKWLMQQHKPKVYGKQQESNINLNVNHTVTGEKFNDLVAGLINMKAEEDRNAEIEEAEEIEEDECTDE